MQKPEAKTKNGKYLIPKEEQVLADRIKSHTCYICMQKFGTLFELFEHKRVHSESEGEDDLFEEDCGNKEEDAEQEEGKSDTAEKVRNLDVLRKPEEGSPVSPTKKKRKRRTKKQMMAFKAQKVMLDFKVQKEMRAFRIQKEMLASKSQKEETKENKIKPIPEEIVKVTVPEGTISQEKIASTKTPFKCDTCNIFFETSDDAKSHISPSASKCKFSCHLCNRKFNTLYAFIVHVMQHKNDTVKNQGNSKSLYNCKLCDKTFSDCFQLKRHEITVHKIKSVSEPICSETTEIMTTRVVVNDAETDNNFTCELCYDIFNTKEELDSHTDFHKQIELLSEPISYPNNKDIEVIEDTRNKHEIITTFQKARNAASKNNNPGSSKFGTKAVLTHEKSLTATIKEMLTPQEARSKQSKTIFLPNIEEEKLKLKRKKISPKIKIISKDAKKLKLLNQLASLKSTEANPSPNPPTAETSTSQNAGLLIPGTSLLKSNNITLLTATNPTSNCITNITPTHFVLPSTASHISLAPPSFYFNSSSSTISTSTKSLPISTSTLATANLSNTTTSSPSAQYAYIFLPNTSNDSLANALIVPKNPVTFVSNNTAVETTGTEQLSNTVSNIPEKEKSNSANVSLPMIDTVFSLIDNIDTYNERLSSKTNDSLQSTCSLSKPTNEDPIIILDTDSDSEEPKKVKVSKENLKKDQIDSDEESNLVIDETLTKSSDNEQNAPMVKIEVTVEPDDIDDHFDEEEEANKSNAEKQLPKKCQNCKSEFQNSEAFEKHEQKKVFCKCCDFVCCKVMELKSHYIGRHKKFFCWRCQFITEIMAEFIKHRSVHSCQACGGVFTNVEEHECGAKALEKDTES